MLKSANGPPTSHQAATMLKSALRLQTSPEFCTANTKPKLANHLPTMNSIHIVLKSAFDSPTSKYSFYKCQFFAEFGNGIEVDSANADFLILCAL